MPGEAMSLAKLSDNSSVTHRPPMPWNDDPDEPAGNTPTELLQLLELQAALLRTVATGGPQIEAVNDEYIRRRERLNGALKRLGIDPPFPWADLWRWHGAWTAMASYRERRTYISELAAPVRERLEQLSQGAAATDPGPATLSWPQLQGRLEGLHRELAAAVSPDDFQDVGRRAREILIDLATLVYLPEMLPATETEQPKAGDAKARLGHAAAALMDGTGHDELRRLIRDAWDLANVITHSTRITGSTPRSVDGGF